MQAICENSFLCKIMFIIWKVEPPLGNLKLAAKKTRLPNDYGLNVSNAGNAKSRSLSFLLRYCKRPILSNETVMGRSNVCWVIDFPS